MWQERPPIIVMLTNLVEKNKIKCQQYWPSSGHVQYGPFIVTITDQQVLADYTIRHLLLTVNLDIICTMYLSQFQYIVHYMSKWCALSLKDRIIYIYTVYYIYIYIYILYNYI